MPRLAQRRSLLCLLPFVVAVLDASLARSAAAQPAGNLTLDAFRPAIDSRGYLTVNASQVLGDGELSFGLGSLDWGHHLLELDADGKSYTIDDMITATLIAAVGLHAGPAELEVGASLPLRIMSGTRGPGMVGGPGGNGFGVDGQGVGNLGLHLKTRFASASGGYIGLGAIASLYLPTIEPRDRFLGEDQWVPQLLGVVDKELGAARRLRLSLNGGIRLRRTTTFTNSDPGPAMAPVTGRSITVGSELPFGLAIAYALAPQRFDLVGEVFGAVPLGAHRSYQPLEALAGVKLYLARNSFLTLGAGRGLVAGQGGNPDLRAFIGIVFEPRFGDGDRGGVGVIDRDRIADTLDSDGDGIPDKDDKCPSEPETYNHFEDEDGCPDRGVVAKVDSGFVTLQPINFEYDRAVIRPDSYYILDAVVAAINGNPDYALIEVQGHTDERGDDAYNLDLSERRAAAVLEYLISHGVDPQRLTSHGYGESQPIDRRHNEAAWAVNRRVSFVLRHRLDN
jgi:outer membrane protein OmpA-like peptidoglycan-associated protein